MRRIERLERDKAKLIEDRDHWKRRSEHLEKELEAARRAGRRQAAPFAKDRPQGRGGRPGRRAGAEYGRQGRRREPTQADETHVAAAPTSCPDCGGAVALDRVASQYQEDLPAVHPLVRRFDIEVGLLAVPAARAGPARAADLRRVGRGCRPTGSERRRAGRRVAHRAGHAAGEGRPRSADPVRTARDQGRPGPMLHRTADAAAPAYAAAEGPPQSGGHAG